jgi:hypothetical protein
MSDWTKSKIDSFTSKPLTNFFKFSDCITYLPVCLSVLTREGKSKNFEFNEIDKEVVLLRRHYIMNPESIEGKGNFESIET